MKLTKRKEGRVILFVPDPEKYGSKYDAPVFYNPVMEEDRDISVSLLKAKWEGREYRVADCLSGTGARAVRYAVEAGAEVYANDHNPLAVELMKKNAEINNANVRVFRRDARVFLLEERPFDVVDIDPFGSPISFLPAAVNSLKGKGSMIFATATDTGALSATFPEVLLRRYGVRGVKTSFYPELGVRNLAYAVLREGMKEDACLLPFYAYARQHYYRVFAVHVGWAKTSSRALKRDVGYYEYCQKCDYRKRVPYAGLSWQEKCPVCGSRLEIIGPTYLGKLWEDLDFKDPYIDLHYLAKKNKICAPKTEKVIRALREKGFRAVKSPFTGKGILTNAGFEEVREIVLSLS